MHTCEICGFQTGRLDAFKRHMNRKKTCQIAEKTTLDAEKTTLDAEKTTLFAEKTTLYPTFSEATSFPCKDCGRSFTTRYNFKVHVSKCKGNTNPLQCDVCMKVFSSSGAKSRHKKNVQCVPPPEVCEPIIEEPVSQSVTNNETINELEEKVRRLERRMRGFSLSDKKKIAAGQEWKCNVCGDTLPFDYHIDHVIPIQYGGMNTISNGQALCVECHVDKTRLECRGGFATQVGS